MAVDIISSINTLRKGIRRRLVNTSPIFVLQMGRVGSTSVMVAANQAYQALELNVPVYHNHYIAHYDQVIERASFDLQDYSEVRRDIEKVDMKNQVELFNYLENRKPVKLISLVRDPVARNVSTFFYSMSLFVPDWRDRESQQPISAEELCRIFESKKFFIQTAFNWFDEQLKDGLGIDIYLVPFDKSRGWQVYKHGLVDLLVLRMEDLYRTGEDALRQFLRLPHLQMIKVNTGEERDAYELYRRFLTHPISQEYLEMTYATKLARHFYTDDEREKFIQRWRSPKG